MMWLRLLSALLFEGPVFTQRQENVPLPPNWHGHSSEALAELMGNDSVQEGDILMPADRNAINTVWPIRNGGVSVPYEISDEIQSRADKVLAAFKMISDSTCVEFRKRSTEENYLRIVDGAGCASFIGMQGGLQTLFFPKACSVGNLVHELLHALGFYHEHTRADRDNFIHVQWTHVIKGMEKNFVIKNGNTQKLPYDVGSIMHYGRFFFSTGPQATILPKVISPEMGQRNHLSALDVQRIRRLYHCDSEIEHGNVSTTQASNEPDADMADKDLTTGNTGRPLSSTVTSSSQMTNPSNPRVLESPGLGSQEVAQMPPRSTAAGEMGGPNATVGSGPPSP